MNDRAKQILIALIAARLIPWVQKVFGVVLSLEDVMDLFVAAVALWHAGEASVCAIMKRYFPPPPNPIQPPQGASSPAFLQPTGVLIPGVQQANTTSPNLNP